MDRVTIDLIDGEVESSDNLTQPIDISKRKRVKRASNFPREYNGAYVQRGFSYSPATHLFLYLVQWIDCHLAGALGLLRILIYKAAGNADGIGNIRKEELYQAFAILKIRESFKFVNKKRILDFLGAPRNCLREIQLRDRKS